LQCWSYRYTLHNLISYATLLRTGVQNPWMAIISRRRGRTAQWAALRLIPHLSDLLRICLLLLHCSRWCGTTFASLRIAVRQCQWMERILGYVLVFVSGRLLGLYFGKFTVKLFSILFINFFNWITLQHNLPDRKGNRYCINLVSIAGKPQNS
jgi:hypothetical protein